MERKYSGPGKSHREGITLMQLAKMFPDEETSRRWLEVQRWPDGPRCPHCGTDNVQAGIKHPTMTHRCRECEKKPMFSVRTGTIMQNSKITHQQWAVGVYLFTTGLKGISSMKLHRELGLTQKAAWFMLHRLRAAYSHGRGPFSGPVEADETYFGGLEKNKHGRNRRKKGRGTAGKVPVAGVKDRATNSVTAKVVPDVKTATLRGFVEENSVPEATVYTDEASAYVGMDRHHERLNHSVGEFVNGMAHTNGIESFWSGLKRGHMGTYHRMSHKHLQRYVDEFSGRYNVRELDTREQMGDLVRKGVGKRLTYEELTADNGLPNGLEKAQCPRRRKKRVVRDRAA